MRLLITLVWTVSCVFAGIALATIEVDGRTPWQHAQRLWKSDGERVVDDVKKKVSGAAKDVKELAATKERPLDRHSADERDALEKLIANRQRDGK